MSSTSDRINKIANSHHLTRYLEIGVRHGDTFLNVSMPHKTAVDPLLDFPVEQHLSPLTAYCQATSDEFFDNFPKLREKPPYNYKSQPFFFDLVFIDGLHVFQQAYRDFLNTIQYTHDDSIIIIDDVIPCDPYSALPDRQKANMIRSLAGISCNPWHGDVFKVMFAIHDLHPEYSFVTQVSNDNPQSIVWKTKEPAPRKQLFGGDLEKIANLSYFDLLDNVYAIVPVDDEVALEMIGMTINPVDYQNTVQIQKIIKPMEMQKTDS